MIRESALSPHMAEAMRVAVMHDGLVRAPGGFWTYARCPVGRVIRDGSMEFPVPDWYVTTHTVKALERRGLIEFPNFKTARLTDAGKDAV
jgi:hypothetical protein